MPANVGWLKAAMVAAAKPKESIIEVLRKHLGGVKEKRERNQLHASDITEPDFCPRQWAFDDLKNIKAHDEYVGAALQATFDLGKATARLLIEDWSGQHIIGDWICRRCDTYRSFCTKPQDHCGQAKGKDRSHLWEYQEVVMEAPEFDVSGSLDAIYDLGSPFLRVAEVKIMAPDGFEKIAAPLVEHRLRTALYLKLIAESNSVHKSKFNLHEATVLYVSRGYGKANATWKGEILPFKEFPVSRDDESIKQPLQKAKSLKIFRKEGLMPNGICDTALDKIAKKCNHCTVCFSGEAPAQQNWQDL